MKRLIGLSLLCVFLLTGCGTSQAKATTQTPEETIHTAFTALKELDMATFNACTNNKMAGGYHMLSDLFGTHKNNEAYQQLAQAMVENLSWEINEVQVQEETATANVTIFNRDFSDALGTYIADLIQQINQNQKDGMDISTLIHSTAEQAKKSPENLLPYLQACQNTYTIDVIITLKQTTDGWQIQLYDSLCDNLTGHLGSKDFSQHVSAKISAAEELLNRNLERWGVSEKTEQWSEKLEPKLTKLFP